MRKLRNRLSSFVLAVLVVAMMAAPAKAYVRVDPQTETSLSVQFAYDKTPVKGMNIRVYKVMEMDEFVRLTPTETFAGYAEIMDLENPEKWTELAGTLAAYIQRDSVAPTAEGATNDEGEVLFSDGMTLGVYLITGEKLSDGDYEYTPQPSFVTLPLLSAEDEWIYEVAVAGKMERTEIPGSGITYTSRNVRKVWDDKGYEEYRPEEITVTLYMNGEEYDTVTLSEENRWRKSWTRLDGDADWSLVEDDVPFGYDVSISQTGNTFEVTNTIDIPEIPDDDVPLAEPDFDDGDGDLLDILDDEIPLAMLPQTGIPWLPVQLLTMAAMMLFVAGTVVLRSGRREEDEA